MKARLCFLPALLILAAACQKEEKTVTPTVPHFTLTLNASKVSDETKALDLTNEGATLDAYWTSTEKVQVIKDGALMGTLDVTPDEGEKPVTAMLGGSIAPTNLSVGQKLLLMLPRSSWDYTGQDGTLGTLSSTYDYATATVTVAGIEAGAVTTTGGANFENQQSVYRFGFKAGDVYFDPKSFVVNAAGGKLVQRMSFAGTDWTPAYGGVEVTAPISPADHYYYVSLRNESTAEETYSFVVTASDNSLYLGSKTIQSIAMDVPGKFISAKSVALTQAILAPIADQEINDPSKIF